MSNVTIKVTIKEKDSAKDFERAETSTFGFDGNYTQAQEVMKKIGIAVQDRSDEIAGRQQLPLNGEVDEEEINEDFPSSRKSKKAK